MTPIIFRDLPAVASVERQLDMQFRDRLLDDELEDLPDLIDDASVALFGITRRDTFYWALPEPVRASRSRAEWEAQFDFLGHYTRDPNGFAKDSKALGELATKKATAEEQWLELEMLREELEG